MKKHSMGHSFVLHILFGLAVSLGVMIVMLLLTAFISSRDGVSDIICTALIVVSVVLAWAAGGFTMGFRNRRSGLIMGVLHAGVMLILLILISLIVRGNEVEIFSTKLLLYLLGGTAASVIGGILGVHFALKNR